MILNISDLRALVGPRSTLPWTVYSASQVQKYGLWCFHYNINDGNIGEWYYPTANGYNLVPNTSNDSLPFYTHKCPNKIGLVVDDINSVTGYQGIVMCNTSLSVIRPAVFLTVYSDEVYNSFSKLYLHSCQQPVSVM